MTMAISEQERLALRESILGYDPFLVEEDESEEEAPAEGEESSEEEPSEETEEDSSEEETEEESEEEPVQEAVHLPLWKRRNFLGEESVRNSHDIMTDIKLTRPMSRTVANQEILEQSEQAKTQELTEGKIEMPKGKYRAL
jgi:hypothetical protein